MTSPIKLKVQLFCGEEIAMGPGKADLIEAIRAQGSISAAARAMGMSYRRAWLLVDTMNRCWREPLIETVPGAAHAGARVTGLGERVLADYRGLQQRLAATEARTRGTLQAALREAPLSAQRREGPAPEPGPGVTPSG